MTDALRKLLEPVESEAKQDTSFPYFLGELCLDREEHSRLVDAYQASRTATEVLRAYRARARK